MAIQYIQCKNEAEIGMKVAQLFIQQVKSKPNSVLLLATGSSPILTYFNIVKDHQNNGTDWSKVTTFNLDEYIDINPKYTQQSYLHFMNENLFNHINIHKSNTYFPNPSLVGDKYQQLINSYTGIDLAILGVGVNGHIAFNEPGTLITATTHIVNLTESSRLANARFFDNDINNVPKQAVSVGLKEILHAKKILLVATGEAKKPAINHLKQTQDFDQQWPITALHKHHDVLVFTDFK